jgi:hypothetical protein
MTVDVESMIVALMYYIQGFVRLGKSIPTPQPLDVPWEQLSGRPYQKSDLLRALDNATIRKKFYEDSVIWRVHHNPGVFTPSKERFNAWEQRLIHFLSGIPGSSGVPLSYIVRNEELIKKNKNLIDYIEI